MAGALSGYLVDSFRPDNNLNSPIITQGAMSFNPNMHGIPMGPQNQNQSFSMFGSQGSFAYEGISESTAIKIASLQVKLNQKLGPEYISQRPGPGGGPKLTYAEGWKIINLANEVFGFNGWSSNIINLTTDFLEYNEESRRYNVGVTAVMRVTLRDGVYHEDVGYGMLENSKSKGQALDKCKKEAVTDGLKRALRNFGNVLGNCLYDKAYTQEVIKIKVPPPKFDKHELHRRPEFEGVKANISSTSTFDSSDSSSSKPHPRDLSMETPTRPHQHLPQHQPPQKPLSSLPPHIKTEIQTSTAVPSTAHLNRFNAMNDHKAPQQPQQHSTRPPHQHGKPPPEAHQERRVTFAADTSAPVQSTRALALTSNPTLPSRHGVQLAEPDGDESFHFFSDDDAFLAAVDLEDLGPPIAADDSDMGRPIEHDTDTGRPIDYGEALNASNDNAAGKQDPGPSTRRVSTASSSRLNAITLAQQQLNPATSSSSTSSGSGAAAGMLSRNIPQHERSRSSLVNHATSTSQSMRTSMSSIRNENQDPNPHVRNSDQHGSGPTAPPLPENSKRPPTSSMGGFHFPSGVNPLQNQSNTSFSTPNPSLSGIGMKRTAEVMSNSFRGSRPGMGLQQASTSITSGSAGSRPVLGRLEVSDGGDVKRLRR